MVEYTVKELKQKFGNNFLGIEDVAVLHIEMGLQKPSTPINTVSLSISKEKLQQLNADDYVLVFVHPVYKDGAALNLLKLREHFGMNPEENEPCFYNQDWYIKEKFVNECTVESKWYLIRKNIFETSRSVEPSAFAITNNISLPSALLCAYTFFLYYFKNKQLLWQNDFVWCSDEDAQLDKVYVGRYTDPLGLSKNGFSIHRHLKIKPWYGVVDAR